jgi:hypothetical protein
LAKKLAFFSRTNVMIQFWLNLALFWAKNAIFFAKFFSENIFKIVTSVPGHPDLPWMLSATVWLLTNGTIFFNSVDGFDFCFVTPKSRNKLSTCGQSSVTRRFVKKAPYHVKISPKMEPNKNFCPKKYPIKTREF